MVRGASKAGFTLIELSIVIVIIALIIGGVLVGRNLIEAATLRNTATMVERYRTAAIAFRGKYGALPGDIQYARAQQFGFTTNAVGACFNGASSGNGIIDDSLYVISMARGNSCEAILFWRHLIEAGMLANTSVDATAPLAIFGAPTPDPATFTEVRRYIPESPIKGATFYIQKTTTAFPMGWINLAMTPSLHSGSGWWNSSAALTPVQGFGIDSKFDDGSPVKGMIIAFDNNTATPDQPTFTLGMPSLGTMSSSDPYCTVGGSPNGKYNMAGPTVDKLACSLAFFLKDF